MELFCHVGLCYVVECFRHAVLVPGFYLFNFNVFIREWHSNELLYCKRGGFDASWCPISKVTFFRTFFLMGGGFSGNVRKLGGIC